MNAKVFTTVSDDKSTIYVYCFYQQDKEKGDHLNQHACQCFIILTEGFELKKGKLYADVIGDILFQNNKVKEIYPHSQRKMNVNIFRYQQALDDSSLLFWRPHAIKGLASEFPAIFFLRLIEGKVLVDMELMPSPLQRVNTDKVSICISVLEIVNNAYLYAQV